MRYAGLAALARDRRDRAAHVDPGRAAAQPGDRAIIGDSPFMDSLIVIITLVFFAAGPRLRARRRDDQGQRPTCSTTITKSWAGLASLLFLFLLIAQFIAYFNYTQDARGRRRQARRLARAARASASVWLLIGLIIVTVDRQPDHPGGDREVGAARADLHPAVPPARHRAADGARRLPGRRLAGERDHPADGVLPADRRLRPALREDAGIGTVVSLMLPVRRHPVDRLDAVLRRLVPDRDPARPGVTGAHGLTAPRHERQHDHVPRARRRRGAVHLGLLPGRAGGGRGRALAVGHGRAQPVAEHRRLRRSDGHLHRARCSS